MRAGFTLVELSIVLVIIGLVIGGITVGNSLLRNAEIQKVTTDYMKYKQAVISFKLRYDALPGDFNEAQNFWPAAVGCPGGSTRITTCNGDGSGTINSGNEYWYVWNHLSLAGLIEGAYSGSNGTGSPTIGSSSPELPIKSIGVGFGNSLTGSSVLYGLSSQLMFHLGSVRNFYLDNGNGLINGADTPPGSLPGGFTVQQAMNIDRKMDDGQPATGGWLAANGYSYTNECVDTSRHTATTASWMTANMNSRLCAIFVPFNE
jgi:prepilin-type N-terminal cleavage/methylation domain-containing protein